MSGNRPQIIQGFFVGGTPRVPALLRRAPSGRAGVAQARGGNQIIPIEPGRLNLGGSVGQPLPDAVRQKMETIFNTDFSDVRVHSGPQAHAIRAIAFTVGSSIYFAPGQYSPGTPHGHELLGHELTHVVQQRAGRVRNPNVSGLTVVQDQALEAEADRMGARAAAFRPAPAAQAKMNAAAPPPRPMSTAAAQAKPQSHKLVLGSYLHADAATLPSELAGHAFVSVQEPSGRKETWGFSPANYRRFDPQKDIGKLRAGVPGVVHRDDRAFHKPGLKTRVYDVTPEQARAAMAKVDEYRSRRYTFSAQTRQCTTFASDVLRAACVGDTQVTSARQPRDLYRKV